METVDTSCKFKECTRCEQIKPISEFGKCGGHKFGYRSTCKLCYKERMLELRKKEILDGGIPTHRDCKICGQCLPLEDFDLCVSGKFGRTATCKKCNCIRSDHLEYLRNSKCLTNRSVKSFFDFYGVDKLSSIQEQLYNKTKYSLKYNKHS
jgi:hypothetical protein